jgi:hypothetical protein
MSVEFEDIDSRLLRDCIMKLSEEEGDRDWLICSCWSVAAVLLKQKRHPEAGQFFEMTRNLCRDDEDRFACLYFKLACLVEADSVDSAEVTKSLDTLSAAASNLQSVDILPASRQQKRKGLLNVSVDGLLVQSSSLLFKACLAIGAIEESIKMIRSCSHSDQLWSLIQQAMRSKRPAKEQVLLSMIDQVGHLMDADDRLPKMIRAVFILQQRPSVALLAPLLTLLQHPSCTYPDDELLWLAVYCHNTALATLGVGEGAVAQVWAEGALGIGMKLSSEYPEKANYERRFREAYLNILKNK